MPFGVLQQRPIMYNAALGVCAAVRKERCVMIRLARFAAAGVLAVICPLAAGQVGGTVHSFEDLISRPSTSGASNLIGGRYTRAGEVDLLRAPKRDVGLLQQDRMSYFRATSRSPRGRVVPSSQLGVFETLAPPRGNPLSLMLTRRESVAEITGLSGAMDFRLPLPGRNEGELPAISASAYTPRPQTTQFQAYFGLRSTTPPTSTATLTSGAGDSAIRVSGQSTVSMAAMASTNSSEVSLQYMTPGPSIMRTALRSLVARAMMSPVRKRE
jgi:hypothetical protein